MIKQTFHAYVLGAALALAVNPVAAQTTYRSAWPPD